MTFASSLAQLLFWVALLNQSPNSLADQVVYLDRAADPTADRAEPVFDPFIINANIGEQIQFVARFGNQTSYYPNVLYGSFTGTHFRRLIHHLNGALVSRITIHHALTIKVFVPILFDF